MFTTWIRKLFRREDVAGEYGYLSPDERRDLGRERDDLDFGSRGVEETWGRTYAQEEDAEEGRPHS